MTTSTLTTQPTTNEIVRAYLAGAAAAFIDQKCPYPVESDLAIWWRKGRAARIERDAARWRSLRRELQPVKE